MKNMVPFHLKEMQQELIEQQEMFFIPHFKLRSQHD
jgi:hypothetical protein